MDNELKDLFNLNPRVSTALAALIGYILIGDMTANEQNALGNFLMLSAQTLITNSANQALIENRTRGTVINLNDPRVKNCYDPFIYDIEQLKIVISQIEPGVFNNIVNGLKNKIDDLNSFYDSNLN